MASGHLALDAAAKVVVTDLAALGTELRDALRHVVRLTTPEIRRAAEGRAPVKTGTLKRSINLVFFDDGDVGSVYVRQSYDPAVASGKTYRAREFPLWIEFGTITSSARPFLIPAMNQMRSVFDARVAAAIQAVGRKHGV